MSLRILAFPGSNRAESFNRKALRVAIAGARDAGADVREVSLADYAMPLYDADSHAAHGLPAGMLSLRAQLLAHDALLIASPEYNSSITPLLKNTIDWLSQSVEGSSGREVFEGKVVGLLGASPGALGTLRSLPHVATILSNLGAIVLPVQGLPNAGKAFDAQGTVVDARAERALRHLGAEVVRVAAALRAGGHAVA
jgi:NAD(P)H-dependent FMN reductase